MDTMNLSQAKKLTQLETISKVLTSKLEQFQEQGQVLDQEINAKAFLLKQKLQSKLIKLVISDLATDQSGKTLIQKQQDEQSHKKLKDFIMGSFDSLNENYYEPSAQEESKAAQQSAATISGSAVLFKAKFGYRFSKLTDKLLRNME